MGGVACVTRSGWVGPRGAVPHAVNGGRPPPAPTTLCRWGEVASTACMPEAGPASIQIPLCCAQQTHAQHRARLHALTHTLPTAAPPLVGVVALVRLVQQLRVLHDLCSLLQDGEGLHDPHRQAEEAGHVLADVLLELPGAPHLLARLRCGGGQCCVGVGVGATTWRRGEGRGGAVPPPRCFPPALSPKTPPPFPPSSSRLTSGLKPSLSLLLSLPFSACPSSGLTMSRSSQPRKLRGRRGGGLGGCWRARRGGGHACKRASVQGGGVARGCMQVSSSRAFALCRTMPASHTHWRWHWHWRACMQACRVALGCTQVSSRARATGTHLLICSHAHPLQELLPCWGGGAPAMLLDT